MKKIYHQVAPEIKASVHIFENIFVLTSELIELMGSNCILAQCTNEFLSNLANYSSRHQELECLDFNYGSTQILNEC